MAFQEAAAVFSGVLLLSFGLTIFLTGLFTSYFGAGKSRKIGLGLVIIGLLSLFAWTSVTFGITVFTTVDAWSPDQMLVGVAALVAGGVGTLVGLGLFLIAVMRA